MTAQPDAASPLPQDQGHRRGSRRRVRSRPEPTRIRLTPHPGPTSRDETLAARGKALLEAHFDLISQRLLYLSRRSGLPSHEGEEFCSWALYKLIEDDYRALASWQGRSSFSTYLTVVLANLLRDYRTRLWGKWRPSSTARREGREAMLLERLLVRDHLSFEEAVHRLRVEHGVSLEGEELERIATCFPQRVARRRVGEDTLSRIPTDGQVEARVQAGERAQTSAQIRPVLSGILRSLPPEDKLLLELHYRDNLTIASIAILLKRRQRDLYLVRDRCLRSLRKALQQAGVSADRVRELIGRQP